MYVYPTRKISTDLESHQLIWTAAATSNINAITTADLVQCLIERKFELFDIDGSPAERLDYWISIRAGTKTSRAWLLIASPTTHL